ncbi:MAG: CHAP domain-containing protein [Candidatus Nanopelagicales bacterium]|nr:CHAP domain-containing protein [Candidatus Nanopelagicales bacterium]
MTRILIPAIAAAVAATAMVAIPSAAEASVGSRADVAAAPMAPETTETRVARAGGAMVSGRRWLRGRGVDVLRGRQCTELATRLYSSRGWGSLSNIYGLRPGRLYGGKIVFHRNGSGYVPVPGDVLVELGGSYQHVAVVDQVTRKAIRTVEQNAVPSGRHIYRWNGKSAFGAYGPRHVGGFIHSRRNPFRNDPVRPGRKPGKAGRPGKAGKRTR